jgi:hypothetical protein
LLLHVTLLHASIAEAPPLLASQELSAAVLPDPSQATVWFAAGVPIEGGVVSTMVNVPEIVDVLPHASEAVKVTVAEPVAPHKSDNPLKLLVHVTLLQASVAVAPALLLNQLFKSAMLPEPSQDTVRSYET